MLKNVLVDQYIMNTCTWILKPNLKRCGTKWNNPSFLMRGELWSRTTFYDKCFTTSSTIIWVKKNRFRLLSALNNWDWKKLFTITPARFSISRVSSVACTYMWSNGVGTVSIHMTRKISCTFVNIWEMEGFQTRFLEYDTCINLILNIECYSCR